ncbi:hypothetical protein BpHYR1_018545, partial [Brachionus plicatilis]
SYDNTIVKSKIIKKADNLNPWKIYIILVLKFRNVNLRKKHSLQDNHFDVFSSAIFISHELHNISDSDKLNFFVL